MEIRELPWYAMGALMDEEDAAVAAQVISDCSQSPKGFSACRRSRNFKGSSPCMRGRPLRAPSTRRARDSISRCGARRRRGGRGHHHAADLRLLATCAMLRGARVVFADIDPVTYNLDPRDVERKITEKTKVIIPVHFGGVPCDIAAFDALSQKYGVKIVYDAAHATGSKYKGQPIGGFGDMTVYSFQTNKNMTTLGEGGAVTTNNEAYFRAIEQIKSFGFQYGPTDDVVRLGSNFRMTKLQSAAGIEQLKKVDRNNELRNRGMRKLNELLQDVPQIVCPAVPEGDYSACHLNTYLIDDERSGIEPSAFFPADQGDLQGGRLLPLQAGLRLENLPRGGLFGRGYPRRGARLPAALPAPRLRPHDRRGLRIHRLGNQVLSGRSERP